MKRSHDHEGTKKGLVTRLATMGAHRHALSTARAQLVDRAREQLDSIGPVIEDLSRAAEHDVGDVYTQRRLHALLSERQRLEAVLVQEAERARAAPGTRP